MNLELLIKIATLALGVIGATKLLIDVTLGKRSQWREEYFFAKQFFEDLSSEKPMHPFVREKGYKAIAGTADLGTGETCLVLTLPQPEKALRDYSLGKPYLTLNTKASEIEADYLGKYQTVWSRRWRKIFYSVLYGACVLAAFSPIWLARLPRFSLNQVIELWFVTMLVFIPYGYFSLKAAVRIFRAEEFVQSVAGAHCESPLTDSVVLQTS